MKKYYLLLISIAVFSFQPLFAQGGSQISSPAAGADINGAFSTMDAASAPDAEANEQDEYYLGRAVAANILAAYKPWNEKPELTRYLNRICQTIAINSPQPEIFNGYHVIILDSPELNAFATPGGHILITRGMVAAASSEDVLAAVLAHEVAHILLKHSSIIINNMKLNSELTATGDRAAGIAGSVNSTAAKAVVFRSSVNDLVEVMMKSGYSQEQELQADIAAITLLAASGYNPGALLEMLQILQRNQGAQKGGFYSTHPSPADRITSANRMNGRYNIQDTRQFRTSRFTH